MDKNPGGFTERAYVMDIGRFLESLKGS